ncbi:MAG: hypothetical protein PHG97_03850 [Candidatus Margulisbacteria bacterium]|nr:hypothetical protein [Candidatus Margulisiibacteriota bacterium]
MILAIDPGKDKCGLAFLDKAGKVLEQKIIKRKDLFRLVPHYQAATIVVGESANGRIVLAELQKHHPGQRIVLADEKDSTSQARDLYWRANPPRGWRRFVPTSFLTPPVPVDDYAAVIIGQRFLQNRS